jgi:hypothetical protein
MTWPPRTILAVSVVVVLIVLVLGATFLPWYRRLPLSRAGRRVAVACVITVLLVLIATVFFLPVYWD